jgi:adenine-specific DNA-methyltransferase
MRAKGISTSKKNGRTETQLQLAQYFTPLTIAEYMADMFRPSKNKEFNLLDAGAGEGILGLTLIQKLQATDAIIKATMIELEKLTFQTLRSNIGNIKNVKLNLINDDFIDAALSLEDEEYRFSHIILNPPYFKLRVDSESSKRLRQNGIQVTNIYAAFVWLSARLLDDNGQLVAIIPRSFCNGPYFTKFRQYLADSFSIDAIHTFSSRSKAFAHDNVLQENIILHISKRKQTNKVRLTYSTDQSFSDIAAKQVPFELIISPDDASKTIHIPAKNQTLHLKDHLTDGLANLGITASTGPVVDFRLKSKILPKKTKGSIPLLYPAHISGQEVDWPLATFAKFGQYYQPEPSDSNVLPLDGHYVVVRRFSSKEEKRRIFAAVVSPELFSTGEITFENHLNYYHAKKHGFDKDLAYGLCVYLNSSLLDEHFRKVSGHTQVNVSDLKSLPYPTKYQLRKIGVIIQKGSRLTDDKVTKELLGVMK